MVIWYRTLQGILTLIIMLGVGMMFVYACDAANYTHAMVVLIVGSIILTYMMVWVAKVQNNIENRKRK